MYMRVLDAWFLFCSFDKTLYIKVQVWLLYIWPVLIILEHFLSLHVGAEAVRVRAHGCGYTTEFTELVRCKFGDAEPSMATLESTNVGADGRVNRLTCNVPLNNVTATVPIAVSLNGVDFTVR